MGRCYTGYKYLYVPGHRKQFQLGSKVVPPAAIGAPHTYHYHYVIGVLDTTLPSLTRSLDHECDDAMSDARWLVRVRDEGSKLQRCLGSISVCDIDFGLWPNTLDGLVYVYVQAVRLRLQLPLPLLSTQ